MLAEVTQFELWQRAVRNQFRHGESVSSLVLGIGALIGVVVVILVIARLQSRWKRRAEKSQEDSHPQRLYTHLMCALGFTAPQRQLLDALARASQLEHPAALLISDVLFDRCVTEWEKRAGPPPAGEHRLEDRQVLTYARNRLFPEGRGVVQSAPAR